LDLVIAAVVGGFASVSTAFKDSIYRDAAQGFHEKHSLILLVFFWGTLAGVATGLLLMIKFMPRVRSILLRLRETNSQEPAGAQRLGVWLAVLAVASLFTALLFLAMMESYTNRVTTWSLTSLERLRAEFEPREYEQMRAAFFSVDNAQDFYAFHRVVVERAQRSHIKLHRFDPL